MVFNVVSSKTKIIFCRNFLHREIFRRRVMSVSDTLSDFVKVRRRGEESFRDAAYIARQKVQYDTSWKKDEPTNKNETFTILSWNILAHCYVTPEKRQGHFFLKLLFRTRHDILYHPSPFQFFYKVHSIIFYQK